MASSFRYNAADSKGGCLPPFEDVCTGGGSDSTQTGQKLQDCRAAINIMRLHVCSRFMAAQSNKMTLIAAARPFLKGH